MERISKLFCEMKIICSTILFGSTNLLINYLVLFKHFFFKISKVVKKGPIFLTFKSLFLNKYVIVVKNGNYFFKSREYMDHNLLLFSKIWNMLKFMFWIIDKLLNYCFYGKKQDHTVRYLFGIQSQ